MRAPRRPLRSVVRTRKRERTSVPRRVALLPLDAAADARDLFGGRLLALQHRFDRSSKVDAGDGLSVAGAAIVELTTIREVSGGIEEEEIGRARRAKGFRHCLRFVEKIRKDVTVLARFLRHRAGSILRIGCDVVGADP